LAPGDYKFIAKAVNHQNKESDQTVEIKFMIYPAYWQTIWFQLFLGVVLFIIFLCGILVRIRLIKKKEEEKTRLNKMLGELELTALKAQMNPHFIFNSLGSIQNLINRDKKTEANIYLSKFAKLLRLTLDNSDKKEIPLADEINMLELYLGLEALRFNNQFEYKIEMDESVDIYEVKIPTMILQPFCENAIKHGLLPKKAEAILLLQFETTEDNTLHCIIQDNGIGRVQREKLKESSVSGHISKGIKITRNRLELVNQLRNKPAEIKITDLYDEENKAVGTRVDILIPLED
jgi:sensor histidine kinase YesM